MQRDWIDPASEAARQALQSRLAEEAAPGEQWFALLDKAFVPPAEWQRVLGELQGCLLYEGKYAGEGVDEASPWLAPLPHAAEALPGWLDGVLRVCAGRPMLSLLQTRMPLQALRTHLQSRLEATVDAEVFVMRYADTRCLPQLWEVLHAEQRAVLADGIAAWCYIDRDGSLQALPLQSVAPGAVAALPVALSSAQQQALQLAALPDTVMAYLRERQDVFGSLRGLPSAVHRCVQQVVQASPASPQVSADTYREILAALALDGLLQDEASAADA
ncbi:DUF4123 domain-containing protein [Xanthomonas maliensis]|uniref:DUF4123 domain-containing protein n=1 Tax=Xanthomonas maliensis TaxID=1321368 RepID=UPI0004CF0077|nr:DUF4123 domain-containing protein [Xanthomonas maliensis]